MKYIPAEKIHVIGAPSKKTGLSQAAITVNGITRSKHCKLVPISDETEGQITVLINEPGMGSLHVRGQNI